MHNEDLKGRYLDAKQVADKYRISIKTVYRYRKTGFLPGFKLGSRVLFDKLDLDARIEEIKEISTQNKRTARVCSTRKIVD
ncbi:MAG: helix-turn-helix domain-containing protein [bacterium]